MGNASQGDEQGFLKGMITKKNGSFCGKVDGCLQKQEWFNSFLRFSWPVYGQCKPGYIFI